MGRGFCDFLFLFVENEDLNSACALRSSGKFYDFDRVANGRAPRWKDLDWLVFLAEIEEKFGPNRTGGKGGKCCTCFQTLEDWGFAHVGTQSQRCIRRVHLNANTFLTIVNLRD